jgi:hypothetical protein
MLKEKKSTGRVGQSQSTKSLTSKVVREKASSSLSQRRSEVYEHGVQIVEKLVRQSSPEVVEQWLSRLDESLRPLRPSKESQTDAFINSLSEGTTPDASELVSLEMSALMGYFTYRHNLLEGSLTTTQVAKLLNTSRQTPHDRAKSGTLLAVLDNGTLRFPTWQFDAEGHDGVVPGLPEVIRALKVQPLAQISWFVIPNRYLDRKTPIQALRAGEVESVIETARAVGVN